MLPFTVHTGIEQDLQGRTTGLPTVDTIVAQIEEASSHLTR